MRNLLNLIKYLSFLLCLSFCLGGMTPLSYAADCNPLCPNGCNADGSCRIIKPVVIADDEASALEEVRQNVVGFNEEAGAIYDRQQERLDQRESNQQNYQNKVSQNDERVNAQKTETDQAQAAVAAAQKKLQNAKTPEEMKAANEALKQANETLSAAKTRQKAIEKDVKKENKTAKKEAKKAEKEIAKAEKKEEKAVKKEQKTAEKDLKSANKKISKLEEKCAKGKCDDDDLADLAAARAKADSAQTALDAANQKANALNAGDQDAAAEEYLDEQYTQEEAKMAADAAEDELAQAKKDIEEAQSNAPKMCNADEIGGNVFLLIACKATTTLADLRIIAYIISGFGMVALSYAAIFGKMNWKHLANIGIGLFLLSMMTPFIEYFTTGKDNTLRFGKYLPAGFSDIQGSDGQVEDCDEDANKNSTYCNQILPEVTVTGQKQKWSLKDLKGSIQAGLGAVRNASDMYKATKSTISNVKSQVSNMKAAIKTGGGGLDGIINAAGAVANATGSIVNSGQLLANNIATNAGELSTNIKDAGSTNVARESRAETQKTLDKLTKKCSAGNCSKQEKEYMEILEETVNNNKTGVNKWLENDGKGGGSTILSGINKVGNITNNVSNSVHNAANAAHEGQSIGGGGALGTILGVGFGAGTAITEGMETAENSKKNGMFDFKSDATKREEKQKAETEAFQKTAGYVKNTQTTADGKKVETLGDGSVRTTSKDGKTTTTVGKDGKTTVTSSDGTTIVKDKDGSKVVTDSKGNKVTYDASGKAIKTELVDKYNRADADSVKNALTGKKEEKKDETKPEEKKEEDKAKTKTGTGTGTETGAAKADASNSKECKTAQEDVAQARRSYSKALDEETSAKLGSLLQACKKVCGKSCGEASTTGTQTNVNYRTSNITYCKNSGVDEAKCRASCANATTNAELKECVAKLGGNSENASTKLAAIETSKCSSYKNDEKVYKSCKSCVSTYWGQPNNMDNCIKKANTAPKIDEGFKQNIIKQCSSICGDLPEGNRNQYISSCKSKCLKPTAKEAAECIKGVMTECSNYKRQLDRGV